MSPNSRVLAAAVATIMVASAATTTDPNTAAPLDAAWRGMARSPFGTTYGIGTWMGERAFFQNVHSGQSLAYDPVADEWRTIARGPRLTPGDASAMWTGDAVVTIGRGGNGVLTGGVFDPGNGKWRAITPHEVPGSPGASVWTGQEVVLPTRDAYGQTRSVAAYAPDTDAWRDLPPPALAGVASRPGVADLYWTGSVLLATSRPWPEDGPLRLYALDPAMFAWKTLAPSPLDQDAPAALWTGDRLLFLGSDPHALPTTMGASYDPATDTWETFDSGCPATTDGAWWTGSLVLDHTYAYEPTSGTCYALPAQPGRMRSWAVEVWTGGELLRWSGSRGEETPAWRGGWRLLVGAGGTSTPGTHGASGKTPAST